MKWKNDNLLKMSARTENKASDYNNKNKICA